MSISQISAGNHYTFVRRHVHSSGSDCECARSQVEKSSAWGPYLSNLHGHTWLNLTKFSVCSMFQHYSPVILCMHIQHCLGYFDHIFWCVHCWFIMVKLLNICLPGGWSQWIKQHRHRWEKLYYTIPYCTTLYYIILIYTMLLYCYTLYCTILYYTVLYYTILLYPYMIYSTILYYTPLCYSSVLLECIILYYLYFKCRDLLLFCVFTLLALCVENISDWRSTEADLINDNCSQNLLGHFLGSW